MRKIFASATAVALALGAGMASAAEWTGTITEIDQAASNITVSNDADEQRIFAVSDMNTVGATIDDLREGDEISVFYSSADEDSGPVINAMTIQKVSETGDAAMQDTAQWAGTVEQVDQSNRTMTVDGQEFTASETAMLGVPLEQLQEGDRVRIVYQDAQGRREVVEMTRVE